MGYTLDEGDECGVTIDHDVEIIYEGDDGVQWECRRCGAEVWEDADV